jgi:hypothetical protein
VLLGASLFAVVLLVIAARLVAITLLPDGDDTAMVPPAKVKTDRADIVLETETTLAFRDINPRATTHVLVIPKTRYRNVADLAAIDSSRRTRKGTHKNYWARWSGPYSL